MNKYVNVVVCLAFAVGLYGCATPRMNLSVPIETNVTLKADKALVYFIRPEVLGFQIHAAVYDDNKFIGFVPYNQKLPYLTEPGEHIFMVVSEAADFMKANLLPGKTYYAQIEPRMGVWRARFSLAPVTKEQLGNEKFRKWIAEARLIDNNDLAYQWADNNHESVLKKKEEYFKIWLSKDEANRPLLQSSDSE